jgi:hypothetical protein
LNRKHPDTHSKKSSISTEAKLPKIVKESSSTENLWLEILSVLSKVALNQVKVMKIVRIVTVYLHLRFPFGVHQNHPQELKSYLMHEPLR